MERVRVVVSPPSFTGGIVVWFGRVHGRTIHARGRVDSDGRLVGCLKDSHAVMCVVQHARAGTPNEGRAHGEGQAGGAAGDAGV